MRRSSRRTSAPRSRFSPTKEAARPQRGTPTQRGASSPSPSPSPSRRSASALTDAAQAAALARWQATIFASLFIGYFLYTVGRRGVTASQDALQSELGFTMGDLGALNSAFTTAYGASKFLGNLLTDFFSARQLFVLGLAAAGVANLTMGVSSSLPLSVTVWAMNGALQGLGWPALSELVMRWFPPSKRGAVWSTCTVSGNVAKTISPVMLTFAASLLGWRGALFAPGGAALLAAVAIFFLLRDSPQEVGLPPILDGLQGGKAAAAGSAAKKKDKQSVLADWSAVLFSVDFWLVTIADVFVYFVLQGFSDWTPLYLREQHGLAPLACSSGLFWYEAGGIFATFSSGFVSDRLQGNRNLTSLVYTALLLPSIAMLVSLPASDGPRQLLLLSAALFVAGAGVNGPKTMCGLEVRERFPGSGSPGALLGLLGQLGAAVAGYPLTLVYGAYGGWDGVLGVLFGASVLATVGFAWLLLRGENGAQLRAARAKKDA